MIGYDLQWYFSCDWLSYGCDIHAVIGYDLAMTFMLWLDIICNDIQAVIGYDLQWYSGCDWLWSVVTFQLLFGYDLAITVRLWLAMIWEWNLFQLPHISATNYCISTGLELSCLGCDFLECNLSWTITLHTQLLATRSCVVIHTNVIGRLHNKTLGCNLTNYSHYFP